MADKPVLLTVFIEPDSEPITGWMEPERGLRRSFSGWLELTAMLRDFQAGAAEPSRDRRPRPTTQEPAS